MEIKSKYDLRDTVFYLRDNRIHENKIMRIAFPTFGYDCPNPVVHYNLDYSTDGDFYDHELFASEADLLNSLKSNYYPH